MEIEFTDRYGGHCPSWLRSCLGHCEAMGFYPHFVDISLNKSGKYCTDESEFKIDEDGFAWVQCERCHGKGKCSWLETIFRIPKWIFRGVRFTFNAPGREDWSFFKNKCLAFKCAFLVDLGLWKP